jgi:hypothetical protein
MFLSTLTRPVRLAAMAAFVALLLTAACGSSDQGGEGQGSSTEPPNGSGSGTDLSYSRGAEDLVLRIETTGGFVPVEFIFTSVPSFSVYGDGRVIITGPVMEIYPGPALPNLLQVRLTEKGMAQLLQAAEEAGLAGPLGDLGMPPVADVGTTVFTLNVGGQRYENQVYALGFEPEGLPTEEPSGPPGQSEPGSDGGVSGSSGGNSGTPPETAVAESGNDTFAPEETPPAADQGLPQVDLSPQQREARRRLLEFQSKLFDLRSFLRDEAGADEPYVFPAVALLSNPAEAVPDDSGIEPTVVSWPLADLASLGEPQENGRRFVVSGADLETIRPLLQNANTLTLWESGGQTYRLLLRPLLPDEAAAQG